MPVTVGDDVSRRDPAGAGVGAADERSVRTAPLNGLAVTGFCGSGLVLAGVSLPGSPFVSHVVGSWPWVPSGVGSGGEGVAQFAGVLLVYAGILALLASWLEVLRRVRSCPGTTPKGLRRVLLAWAVPLCVAPPLFSLDVFSYAAQGEMVSRGINPYAHGPSSLGASAFLRLVDPRWAHTAAPYGPGWERLGGWLVQLARHSTPWSVAGFRATAVLGVALLAWAVPSLAGAIGARPGSALAAGVLNPLVLLVLLGGAHNDALMLGLLVASCALAARGRVAVALFTCALAAEVKAPALLAAAFIGWAWWPPRAPSRTQRVARAAEGVAVAVGMLAVLSAAAGLGWRWIPDLVAPGGVTSWLDPATAAGLGLAHLVHALGVHVASSHLVTATRVLALLVALGVSVKLLLRSDRVTAPTALGWSLLVVALLGPIVWPWYEAWGFVLLACAAERATLRVLVVLSAIACFADVQAPHLLVSATPAVVAPGWAALVGAVAWYLWRRRPWGTFASAPLAVPDLPG